MNQPIDTLVQQITSYNLFNYLLPGTLFCFLMNSMFGFPFLVDNLFVAFFAYYFAGLSISRIGSLLVEPAIQKLKLVKYAPYGDILNASAVDPKVDILSEQNNVYRTLISLPICMFVFLIVSCLFEHWKVPLFYQQIGSLFALLILFIFSYVKQSKYVAERVMRRTKSDKT